MLKLSIIFFSFSLILADDLNQISKGTRWVYRTDNKVVRGRTHCPAFLSMEKIGENSLKPCWDVTTSLIKNNKKRILSSSEEASPQKARNGRLFYVYTQKTTTTLITATNCYVTSTGLTACGRRKKRALINQEDLDVDIDLAPSV